MAKQASVQSLEDRAAKLREDRGDQVAIEDISSVVGSLVSGDAPVSDGMQVATELREILDYIGAAQAELDMMQPKNMSMRKIPGAHDQLDAVVAATEDAASTIMDAADIIGEVAGEIDEKNANRLLELSTNLFEASSFQDLTGQRITRVVTTLQVLEERLSSLADAIGDDFVEPLEEEIETDNEGVAVNDDDLLHGPQLEGEGNSQAEIDALLASFD